MVGEPGNRRLTILDAMIFVAAVAVAIVGTRFMLSLLPMKTSWWGVTALFGSVPVVLSFTLAHILIRLRQPRPPVSRLCRQPGWLASIMVVTALAIGIALRLLTVISMVTRS